MNVIISVLVLFILIILVFVRYQFNENQTRNSMASIISLIGTPNGCVKNSRYYQTGGVDQNSYWSVHFKCNAIDITKIHNDITGRIEKFGYQANGTLTFDNNTINQIGIDFKNSSINFLLEPAKEVANYPGGDLDTSTMTDAEIRQYNAAVKQYYESEYKKEVIAGVTLIVTRK